MFEKYIEENQDLIIKDLIDLINIDTTVKNKKPNMPYGEGVYKGLKYILNKGEEFNFKTQNYCGQCGHVEVGNGLYTVGILCNVDVSSDVEGWKRNPFVGALVDNKVYGKGALSCKGPLIACLYAMKFLNDENLIPDDKRIRLIVGCDKNFERKSINYYKEYEEAPDIGFTPDGVFPVVYGEKGIIDMTLKMRVESEYNLPINIVEIYGGKKGEGVPGYANIILSCDEAFKERICDELIKFSEEENIKYNIFCQNKLISIDFLGKKAKSFMPEEGLNSISYAIKFIGRFKDFIDRREFIEEYEKLIGVSYNGELINCEFESDESGEFTFNVEEIKLVNDEVRIEVRITHPIRYMYSEVVEKVRDGFKYSTFKITNMEHLRPVSFSKDSFVIKKLLKAYRDATGDLKSEPYTTVEGSYARTISNTVAFGPIFPNEVYIESDDEFISKENLSNLIEIYGRGLYELLK